PQYEHGYVYSNRRPLKPGEQPIDARDLSRIEDYGDHMNESLTPSYGHRNYSFTARDVAAIGFRHQKVLILCFVGVMLGVGISSLFLPSKYKAETKLLVKRERVDPVITPEQNAPLTFHDTVGEEEINSELEIMTSSDVLRKVVTANNLDKKH